MVTWPAGATVRPLEQKDAEAAVELANAIAAADGSGQYVTLEDYSDALAMQDFSADSDSLGVWSSGRLVGYGLVPGPDVLKELSILQHKGGVHPDHRRRGFGGPLLDWLTGRAGVRSREEHPGLTTTIDVDVEGTNLGALALLAGRGYEPIRYYSTMQRPYAAEMVAAAPASDEFRVVPFDPAYDESLRLGRLPPLREARLSRRHHPDPAPAHPTAALTRFGPSFRSPPTSFGRNPATKPSPFPSLGGWTQRSRRSTRATASGRSEGCRGCRDRGVPG
jgi:ribosomal protein S18 acetylase RimI-like enzyme